MSHFVYPSICNGHPFHQCIYGPCCHEHWYTGTSLAPAFSPLAYIYVIAQAWDGQVTALLFSGIKIQQLHHFPSPPISSANAINPKTLQADFFGQQQKGATFLVKISQERFLSRTPMFFSETCWAGHHTVHIAVSTVFSCRIRIAH